VILTETFSVWLLGFSYFLLPLVSVLVIYILIIKPYIILFTIQHQVN